MGLLVPGELVLAGLGGGDTAGGIGVVRTGPP